MRKSLRKLQSWHWRSARAELRTTQKRWFCELPASPDSSCYVASSNGSYADDVDYEAFNDRAKQNDQSQTQHNRGQTDHGLIQITRGKVIGNIVVGDIHKTCGTLKSTTIGGVLLNTKVNTKGSFTGDRWTEPTLLVNIMTHTTFTQSNL